ncbi:ABC transporter ATP-binding protein [Halalkalibacter urbisdiaboli]|uniref:ABC transporter ATP-binding protein n=1 Tax=Halalkalibacter urbisdiaboli TaxID=1960589 RepID=UPI000B448FA3|nr:ABC transporter ATP-binding protein [Halalkalibacter urbisdiaboli]
MRIDQLTKTIHGETIIEKIDFSIEPGKVTGLIGRNGAGKTTLLRLMVGILKPSAGDVKLDGKSIYQYPQLKADIVFVPDSSEALKTYTIKEIVNLYKAIYPKFDQELFYQLIEQFNLPQNGKINSFSKGMKALFALVLAFSTRAKYVLLDEPTDGLDVIVKKQMLQFIVEAVADYNVAVVISSHRLDELEYLADSIVMIKEGKVASSYSLDSLKVSYKKVQAVFPAGLPSSIQEKTTILQQTGKVFILVLEGDLQEGMEMIRQARPIFYEELPITLEDLFVAKLGGDQYAC